jgi:MFS family permease
MTESAAVEAEVERNYRFNFIVNFLDGTFFWWGASFIAPRTILPLYVSRLTDSSLAIGLLATISATAWLLPQLFTANWVQRLPRKKEAPVRVGLFTERLPVLLLVPAAWLANRSPGLALTLFFVLFAWHAVGAGVVAVGWQDMLAKVIPVDRRGRFLGVTNFGGTATGVVGAVAAAWLLDRYDFPQGYMYSFAAAAALIFISWIFLALTREPLDTNQEPVVSSGEYWKRLPGVLRADRNFRRFLLSQVVVAWGGMALGFLAVYAVRRWGLPDSQAGDYTASMLIGQALSNLLFGALADRKGHKLVLELSALFGVSAVVLAYLAPGPNWFHLIFAFVGANAAGSMLGGIMIVFEFTKPEMRPTYIGLSNTIIGVFNAITPLIGGWIVGVLGYRPLFAMAAALGAVGFALLRWTVREPRHSHALDAKQASDAGQS